MICETLSRPVVLTLSRTPCPLPKTAIDPLGQLAEIGAGIGFGASGIEFDLVGYALAGGCELVGDGHLLRSASMASTCL